MRSRVTTTPRNRQEPLEDEELQQLITERIEEDPVFWTGSGRRRTYVTVEVEDGHVVLSGLVRSPLDRRSRQLVAVHARTGDAEEERALAHAAAVVREVVDLDREGSDHLARGERPDQGLELHARNGNETALALSRSTRAGAAHPAALRGAGG